MGIFKWRFQNLSEMIWLVVSLLRYFSLNCLELTHFKKQFRKFNLNPSQFFSFVSEVILDVHNYYGKGRAVSHCDFFFSHFVPELTN